MQIESLGHTYTDTPAKLLFRRSKEAIFASWLSSCDYTEYLVYCTSTGSPIASRSSYEEEVIRLDEELAEFTKTNSNYISFTVFMKNDKSL